MKIEKVKINKNPDEFKISQSFTYKGEDEWDWSIWVNASDINLDKLVNVRYLLHRTFFNPVRIIDDRKTAFRLDTSGWGTFTIYATLNFKDNTVLEIKHDLDLSYPDNKSKRVKK
jgi:transcription initiation factor IIF auxiliary subunit